MLGIVATFGEAAELAAATTTEAPPAAHTTLTSDATILTRTDMRTRALNRVLEPFSLEQLVPENQVAGGLEVMGREVARSRVSLS
jgi:hypothetical protein